MSLHSFFSLLTLKQMVSYGLVGLGETGGGLAINQFLLAHGIPTTVAYFVPAGSMGFIAFLLRKYWTFTRIK